MRLTIRTALLMMVLTLVACTVGCGWDCGMDATCEPKDQGEGGGETGEPPGFNDLSGLDDVLLCPEDPAESRVAERCGVWAATTGDDANDGTQAAPVKTIMHAIELAKENGTQRVYACGGTYSETVVNDGVSLFGGFDCENDWKYVGEDMMAEISSPPAVAAMALLETETLIQIVDFRVLASDATEPGGSSIAVLALPGSRAFFNRAWLVAGKGADGADGEDGSLNDQPAMAGPDGLNGADACTGVIGSGGAEVSAQCPDGTASFGGAGGDGNEIAASSGLDGLPLPNPNPQNFGLGGEGEIAAKGTVCTPGFGGAHGQSGSDGAGASSVGRLTVDGYLGVWGGDGTPGLRGQGGGGGGASLGNALCGAAPHGGAGGGSGGAGGCGGKGGKGGQPGGSSIALALLSNGISGAALVLVADQAGAGGRGGHMQPGGQGGLPGFGGIGADGPDGALNGCGGGIGGHGGNGGNGGGGHGGHSLPFAMIPGIMLMTFDYVPYYAPVAKGGKGGNPGFNDGWYGASSTSMYLDP